MMLSGNDFLKLGVSLVAPLAAGFLGALATQPAVEGWYEALQKPTFTAPVWMFSPVWTTLYILMGVAVFLVWRHGCSKRRVRTALVIFVVQLVLNAGWSVVFFGLRAPGWALVHIIVLLAAIIVTIIAFSRVSRAAAWLLVPYLAWVAFATYLTVGFWMLN
jgi:tryptophan-rich sensory protein